MFTKKNILLLTGATLLFWGCQKIVHGYLSDRIFYQVNPFIVQQGVTTVSASLVTDGSTAPLHVKVLALRDSLGNDVDSILTKPGNIVTYTGTLTPADSTLALFNAKLKDSLVSPFNIAELGGRLQFTAATTYVPPGTYNMDLLVSNVRGERVLKNACAIQIIPLSTTSVIDYKSFRTTDPTGTKDLVRYENDDAYMQVDIDNEPSTDATSKIILKYVDKNGISFNPSKGEVKGWDLISPIATTYFPTLHMWAPYYPIQYTDSTIVQQIPYVNLSFPYFDLNSGYPASGGARIDYRISNTSDNAVYHTVLQFSLFTAGTYNITIHLNAIEHK